MALVPSLCQASGTSYILAGQTGLTVHLHRVLNPQAAKLAKDTLDSQSESDGSPVPNLLTKDTTAMTRLGDWSLSPHSSTVYQDMALTAAI